MLGGPGVAQSALISLVLRMLTAFQGSPCPIGPAVLALPTPARFLWLVFVQARAESACCRYPSLG